MSNGAEPLRLQLSRAKGFSLQRSSLAVNGRSAVNCARPGKWGNPWPVGKPGPDGDTFKTAQECVDRYSMFIGTGGGMPTEESIRRELRGRNLACWCALDQPCHADVLLEIANMRFHL